MAENEHLTTPARATATKPRTATEAPARGGGAPVLALQRSAGNAATARLLQGGGGGAGTALIQRKPTATSTLVEHSETGTKTTTETTRGTAPTTTETGSDTFDGTTRTTIAGKDETFVGAGTAVKRISSMSNGEITEAVELLARAGAFGESSRQAAMQRGALSVKAQGSAKGGAGAEAGLKASVTISPDAMHALVAVLEAGAKVGLSGDLEGSLEAALGPLSATIKGQLSAFAGAMAGVKAKLDVGSTHLYAEASAKAMAGAEGSAKGEASIKLGNAEATAAIEGTALAGAKAEAGGVFKIDLTGVELSGKAEAFAGVSASGSASAGASYKGKTLFKATGTIGVSAGVGGKAEGAFAFRGGKLVIKGNLAGALGIGGEVGLEVEIDFVVLALAIEEAIVKAFLQQKEAINRNSPSVPRIPIIEEERKKAISDLGYGTYLKDFKAYDAKKAKQGNTGIKRERIQEILDARWHANKDNWQFVEFDEGIQKAAKEAFGAKLTDIIVQCGQLRAFEVVRTAEQQEHLKKERQKAGLKF